ncbi:aquaporin-8 isoform X2 [Dama dama]|uniref:aquaporin-8 isoform X2 n=1 Tax=Dama dama TaxID=30532 RepID=UPI002A36A435|nr:aquaporin-8 isoform X2 [Dama dama]
MFTEAAASMCDLESGSVKVKEPRGRGRGQGGWYERLVQPCLVELLGSALFIFIGCLSVIENGPDTGRLQPALAHGLALGLVIATLGNISGGHFNPAVSLAAMLVGGLRLTMLFPYWISQLCGGLIGAALAKGCCVWSMHESCPGLRTCHGGQPLGLPLDLLAGPPPGQPACRSAHQALHWRCENSSNPKGTVRLRWWNSCCPRDPQWTHPGPQMRQLCISCRGRASKE